MPSFQPLRITKERNLLIKARPSEVFPLLCPVREYDWIESWKCDLRFSENGYAETNCIFETDFAQNGGKETWVVSRYEKNHCIEFVRFTAGEKVVKLNIGLTDEGDQTTRLLWQLIYTGLSRNGNELICKMADEQFAPQVLAVENMLNHFVVTG